MVIFLVRFSLELHLTAFSESTIITLADWYVFQQEFLGSLLNHAAIGITSLLLLAGVAWLTNSLHATPDLGPA